MKKLFAIALLSVGMVSGATQAGFVQTDWKVAGDNQAILDTSTGVEWLKLTQTRGMSINTVLSGISNGLFEGWRLPTNAEVERLFLNWWPGQNIYTYSTTSVISVSSNFGQANLLFNSVFGNGSRSANHTRGLYYDENNKLRVAGVYQNVNSYFYGLDNSALFNEDSAALTHSIFLVSDGGVTLSSINDPTLNINNPNAPINQGGGTVADVSAPAGLFALLSGLFFFARRRG